MAGKVISVNISKEKGTVKHPVEFIELFAGGVSGDAHAGKWHRQVSLLAVESIWKFEKEANRKLSFGDFAENITTEGLELHRFQPLDKIKTGSAEMEVTQIGKKCHGSSCAIYKEVGNCIMPVEGIFCRVLVPGIIKSGQVISHTPRMFNVHVITLSDRASMGEYEDRSGPAIIERVSEYFKAHGRLVHFEHTIIGDEPEALRILLDHAENERADLVITTGGTGIGPRDITPDVVADLLDKEIPGIMESIRMKFGSVNPSALLSRGVAGTIDQTLIFTLPGSVRAVKEYLDEITKNLLHLIYMLHGLDIHR